MLLFNGLYFRGNWAMPFGELKSNQEKHFNALSGKQDIKFMTTCGSFKYAEIPTKKLIAVELPYKVSTQTKNSFDLRIFNFVRVLE